MFEYIKTWVELKTDRRAVTALEYALIAGVIVATILVGFQVLAERSVEQVQRHRRQPVIG